jgi:PhnB protein
MTVTLVPYIVVSDAARALQFYTEAFGAVETARLTLPDGKIAHAAFRIGEAEVYITDENPEWNSRGPLTLGGTPVVLHLYVSDVDFFVDRATAAGATIVYPVADQFYGDRSGRVRDPFGHEWLVSTRKEEVSVEEMQRRLGAMTE